MPQIGLAPEYYEHSMKLLDIEYKYGINHVITIDGFFDLLKPKNKINLIFIVLQNHYQNFQEFFYDDELPFVSEDTFIISILSNLKCNVFDPGETILKSGAKTKNLYFIQEGDVIVKDKKNSEEVVALPQHSWFGDYQLFMGSASNYNFIAGEEGAVVLYVSKKLIIE